MKTIPSAPCAEEDLGSDKTLPLVCVPTGSISLPKIHGTPAPKAASLLRKQGVSPVPHDQHTGYLC